MDLLIEKKGHAAMELSKKKYQSGTRVALIFKKLRALVPTPKKFLTGTKTSPVKSETDCIG